MSKKFEWLCRYSDLVNAREGRTYSLDQKKRLNDNSLTLSWRLNQTIGMNGPTKGIVIGLRNEVPPIYRVVTITYSISISSPTDDSNTVVLLPRQRNMYDNERYGSGPFNLDNGSLIDIDKIKDYCKNLPEKNNEPHFKFVLQISGIDEKYSESYMLKQIHDSLVQQGNKSKFEEMQEEIDRLGKEMEESAEELKSTRELLKERDNAIRGFDDEKKKILEETEKLSQENKKLGEESRAMNRRIHELEKGLASVSMIQTLKDFDPKKIDLSGIDLEKMRDLMSRLLILQSCVIQQVDRVESCSRCNQKKRNCVHTECGHLLLCDTCYDKEKKCSSCDKDLSPEKKLSVKVI